MRQRLLLVAGWLIAAIGSVLVASGAVAIAGGQVLDRPLRPLTAAEVAALPVVAVGLTDATEPQASGGIARTTGESTAGSETADADLTESVGAGGSSHSSSSSTTDESDGDSDRWNRFTSPSSSRTHLEALKAGAASFAVADGQLHLLWVTPGAGYVAHALHRDSESITISFSSSHDVWLVIATIVDGELNVESRLAPIA